MKNIKKILMIVCCFCLTFLFAACDLQKDVNIVSIEVVETTVPATIEVGKFNQAGIQIRVNYADQTHETIGVTSTMLGDEYENYLYTPGTYTVTILFRGQTTELTIKIVPAEDVYTVSFYNGANELIDRQMVQEGADAEAPNPLHVEMQGYRFVAWVRTFDDVTENLNIYGIYTKLDADVNSGEGVAYNEILFKAVSQMENGIFNMSTIDETHRNRTDATYMYKNGALGTLTSRDYRLDDEAGLVMEDIYYTRVTREETSLAGQYTYYKEAYGVNGYHKSEYSADDYANVTLYAQVKSFVTSNEFVSFGAKFYGNETIYELTLITRDKEGSAPTYTHIYFNADQVLMVKVYTPSSSADLMELQLSVYYTMHPTTYVEFPYQPNEG